MKRFLLAMLFATVGISCRDSSDPIPPGPDPSDNGSVEIQVTIPDGDADTYKAVIDDKEYDVSADGKVKVDELAPGDYTIYVFNEADKVNSDGTIARVDTVDGVVDHKPELLYFGSKVFTIASGDVVTADLELAPMMRPLTLKINVSNGDEGRISKIQASLSGIASEWECLQDIVHGDPAMIKPEIVKYETKNSETPDYIGEALILGINGASQVLTLTIYFGDGSTQNVEQNVSSLLEKFNDDKKTEFDLLGEIQVPAEGDLAGTIVDWDIDQGGDVTVN